MSNNENNLTQYFLTELNLLENRAMRFEDNKASRINFFLLLFGISLAGVTSGLQAKVVRQKARLILGSLSAILIIISVLSLKSQIIYSSTIVTVYRRSGKIKRWFLDNKKGIASYLIFEPADDKPSYSGKNLALFWRGAEPILIILNAVLFSTLLVSIFALESRPIIFISISILSFFLFYLIQVFWIQIYVRKYQKNKDNSRKTINGVMFPFNQDEMASLIEEALKIREEKRK